jgi:hypothetical protein
MLKKVVVIAAMLLVVSAGADVRKRLKLETEVRWLEVCPH